MPTFDLAFVDSISGSPVTRLNLNDDNPWRTLAEDTTFEPPPLNRALVSNLLADGGVVTAAAYENRTIQLALRLPMEATADQAATHLQALARELDRPGNFLRYRPDTTAPVFFRTFRSSFSTVIWDPVQRRATVQLLAEPFAYGLKETLATATPGNNPAGTMWLDVTGVKGDVPAPLNLVVGASGVVSGGRRKTVIAVRRRGTPSAAPFALQAEAMSTASADTTVQPNSTLMSGAGSNYVRTTFASIATAFPRVSIGPWPTPASVDLRGTYRVYARVRQNTGSDVIEVQLRWGAADVGVENTPVVLPPDLGPSAPTVKYVDLGLVQMPVGTDVPEDFAGAAMSSRGINLAVWARRISGTGSLDIDVLLFVPADDRMLLVTWPDTGGAGATDFYIDSDRSRIYGRGTVGELFSTQAPEIEGGFPMVSPGVTNRVYVARDVGITTAANSAGDVLTGTLSITPSYFPRYQHVRPPTT